MSLEELLEMQLDLAAKILDKGDLLIAAKQINEGYKNIDRKYTEDEVDVIVLKFGDKLREVLYENSLR